MAATKRKKSGDGPSATLLGGASWRRFVSIQLLGGIATVVLVVVAAYFGWKKWGAPVTEQERYRLSLDSIAVTPQPAWIPSDVKSKAARDGSLESLSIFDKQLTVRVCRAFEMHAWVERVNRVSKRPPARVEVGLVYRRPVAWVEVPPGVLPNNEVGLLPVDAQGVLLPPKDFSPEQVNDYLRIAVAGLTPCGLPGTLWGDPRVAAAAEIAAMLTDDFEAAEIYRILVSPQSDVGDRGPEIYEVTTRNGARFIWGSPPGRERSGEPTAMQKKLRLIQLAESAAKADSPEQWRIDLRDPNATRPAQRTAGTTGRFSH